MAAARVFIIYGFCGQLNMIYMRSISVVHVRIFCWRIFFTYLCSDIYPGKKYG